MIKRSHPDSLMKQQTLSRIAITVTIIGLVLLFLISKELSVSETTIDNIDNQFIGQKVKLKGTAERVYTTNTTTIITMSQPSVIKIFGFGNTKNIEEGDQIEVIGHVEEYEDEMEIVADRIRVMTPQ